MRLEVHKCNYCGMIVEDYLDCFGWIHFNDSGFKIVGNQSKRPRVCRYGSCLKSDSEGLDFCSLACFVKWLFLSKDTDYRKDYNKNTFLKEVIKSLIHDNDLKGMIIDCLKSENL